jgi:pimeloyl-ACP methyl ester carboxylesterase
MPYVKTRLGRWFYDEDSSGDAKAGGRAIVLLPSLLCDGSMWRGQRAPLARLGRVLTFDPPGHGKSDVPPPFTLDEHTRALIDAFDALDVTRAVVVGLSWGGMTAMRLALYRPERLAAMVLLDTSADGTRLRERIEYRALCALALRIGLPPSLVRARVVPLMFADWTQKRQPELVDEFVRTMSGFPVPGLVRAAHAVSIERGSIVPQLQNVATPTLVGYGEDDVAIPATHARRIASRIGGAELVTFPRTGHLSALEDPDGVNAAVVPFVAEHMREAG